MTEPIDGHSHDGTEIVLLLIIVLGCLGLFGVFMGSQYQFDVIYDRVGEMQRQLECPPEEVFVTDQDGIEYCLGPEDASGT